MKLARRNSRDVVIVYTDMDGLKNINDTQGHSQGDAAIKEVTEILRSTFRESDILARIGGDEFVILIPDVAVEPPEAAVARLLENVRKSNDESRRMYQLSISVGTARLGPSEESSLEALLARADKQMYDSKRANGKARVSS